MKKIIFIFFLFCISVKSNGQVYNLGNTVSVGGWYKLGTLALPQQGSDAEIEIYSGAGYNANSTQNGESRIHFRTSNGTSENNGFYGSGSFYNTGSTKILSGVKVVQVNISTWDFYAQLPVYSGSNAFLSLKSAAGSWQSSFSQISPPSNVISLDLKEEFLISSNVYDLGNVGIGTTTPIERLNVNGGIGDGIAFDTKIALTRTSSTGNVEAAKIVLDDADTNFGNLVFSVKTTASSAEMDNYYSDAMTIKGSNANVGIGTSAPDEKLTVKGKIHAQEVRIDLAAPIVPDYVFANDYKLKTLKEVEEYIKKNSHLPELPSAKEFEKNGLLLAEMNMSLLKKVEELTLYAIEQDKKVKSQSEYSIEQGKKLNTQSKEIEALKKDNELIKILVKRSVKAETQIKVR